MGPPQQSLLYVLLHVSPFFQLARSRGSSHLCANTFNSEIGSITTSYRDDERSVDDEELSSCYTDGRAGQ